MAEEMDEIERLIRAAKPPSIGNRWDPLTERAKRELDELLVAGGYAPVYAREGAAAGPMPRSRRFGLTWFAAAAAVVAATFVAASLLWPGATQSAQAATPPLLVVEPLDEPGAQVLADLARAARESEFDVPTEGEEVAIRIQSWALHMEIGVDGQLDPSATVVSPEVHTFAFRPDGSMSQVVTAGQAYSETGVTVDQEPAVGTVLGSFEQGPGEYEPLFSAPAPRSSDEVAEFLTVGNGLPAGESASNAFHAVSNLLFEQRLDNLQTGALLEFLAALPDYAVDGTTTDRLGRAALVLTAAREGGEYTDSLLLDAETGQILASETIYIGTSRTDLTAPAVTEYHAWEKNT